MSARRCMPPHQARCTLYSRWWFFKERVCAYMYECVITGSEVKRDFIEGQHTVSRMSSACMFLCACTQPWVFPHSLFDPGVMCLNEWAHVSAAAHGCFSLMRRAVRRRGSHLMRAVEMVKHTAGLHVISVSLALDMAQFQTHAHTQTHVDNCVYW